MKIKKLTIEGMHKVTKQVIEFDQLNYVYGPNGAGKSTILQAIQLALLGYIPGQSKASKEAIFRHSNGRGLVVTVELDNDGQPITIERTWAKIGNSITASVIVNPEVVDPSKLLGSLELPVFNFNEFMGMTANKLKDWFIDFLPSSDTKLDLWSEMVKAAGINITPEFEAMIQGYLSGAGISDLSNVTVDEIRQVNTLLKSLMSTKKSELSRAEGAIQSLIHYDDFEELYSESEFNSKLSYAMNGLVAQKAYESQKSQYDNYMNQLKVYQTSLDELNRQYDLTATIETDSELKELLQQLNYYVNHYRQYNVDVNNLNSKIADVKAQMSLQQSIVSAGDVCVFTKTRCESIRAYVEEAANKIIELHTELNNLDTLLMRDMSDLSEITAKQNEIKNQMSKKEEAYKTKDQLESKINFILQQTATITPPADDRPIAEWQQMIDELQEYKTKLEANRQYNSLIDILTTNKFNIDSEIECIKRWDKLTGVNGLQSECGDDNPFTKFAAKLDKYIPILFGDNCRSNFNISEKANSFNFGIMRDASYIPFDLLSSGEKCMYTLALMTCIADDSDSALKLILVDDMFDHLDDANIAALFTSLSKIENIQMIFAGVREATFGNAFEVPKSL